MNVNSIWRSTRPAGQRAGKGTRAVLAVLAALVLAGVSLPIQAQQPPRKPAVLKKAPPIPNRDAFIIMTREIMIAVNQANQTGNYSVLRELGSPDFQKRYSTADLSNRLASFRKLKINLGPAALFVPKLTQPAKYVKRNVILLSGFFPTTPRQIKFEMFFEIYKGAWRLHEFQLYVI